MRMLVAERAMLGSLVKDPQRLLRARGHRVAHRGLELGRRVRQQDMNANAVIVVYQLENGRGLSNAERIRFTCQGIDHHLHIFSRTPGATEYNVSTAICI